MLIRRNSALYFALCVILVLALGTSFTLVSGHWEFVFIDTILAPDDTQTALGLMSPGQKEVHLWATWLLDLPYPLALWGLTGGLICVGLSKVSNVLIWVPRLACLVDLVENSMQTAMLMGVDGLIAAKSAVTLAKFGVYAFGFLLALTGLIALIVSRLRHRRPG